MLPISIACSTRSGSPSRVNAPEEEDGSSREEEDEEEEDDDGSSREEEDKEDEEEEEAGSSRTVGSFLATSTFAAYPPGPSTIRSSPAGHGAMYSCAPRPPIIPTSDSTLYQRSPIRSMMRSYAPTCSS